MGDHRVQFRQQAANCHAMGSPFSGDLLLGLAYQIGKCDALDALIAPYPDPNPADVFHLRLLGALHALTLTGHDEALAALYPRADPDPDMPAVITAALGACETHADWIARFIQSVPQTNEALRTVALLPGFAEAARHGPLHMLELGASAGLNQHWDKFAFDGGNWTWNTSASGVPRLRTDWQGDALVIPVDLTVASRAGCDLAPIDLEDEAARQALRAYVWPDQTQRARRLETAIRLARELGVTIDQASADDWLAERLEGPLPEGTTVIYHSIVWSYFPKEVAERAEAIIRAAGTRANDRHRLYWLRYEFDTVFANDNAFNVGNGFTVDRIAWPGGEYRKIASAHPHAAWVLPA